MALVQIQTTVYAARNAAIDEAFDLEELENTMAGVRHQFRALRTDVPDLVLARYENRCQSLQRAEL